MSGGTAYVTPTGQGTLSRIPSATPPNFVSPSTRRLSVVLDPIKVHDSLPHYNDDEKERRERRRSRILSAKVASPATPNQERRYTAPLSSFSNNQLAEHYANCIKLSTENKINAKNAFGLHLIDYLSEMVKKKEMNNFQVASSTLDASAKIYAGRVDAIHSETYKVLTGLGQGMDRSKDDEQEADNDDDTESTAGPDGAPKRKRARKSHTIETNLKNININKLDLKKKFEVDPLFKKTTAAFDEGGVAGLLLNNLRVLDDTSELILDSNTIAYGHETSVYQGHSTPVPLKDLQNLVNGFNLEVLKICPSFANFEFSRWSLEGEETFISALASVRNREKIFDLDAEAEPIPDLVEDEGYCAEPTQLGADDFTPDDDEGLGAEEMPETETLRMGDGREAVMVQSAVNKLIDKEGTVNVLMQVLATEPGEYSYFNTKLMRTWAGPAHWKLKVNIRDKQAIEAEQEDGKKKDKKVFELNLDEDIARIDKCLRETRAATTLAKATLDKYTKAKTTLPEDLHYDVETLLKLFAKPKIMLKRSLLASEDGIDEDIDIYNYNNANDQENFVPAIQEDDEDDHYEGFDMSAGVGDTMIHQESTASGLNDSLVAQPKKVEKVDIGYAKTAKKMDVKKLKSAMWTMLTKTVDCEEDGSASPEKGEKRKQDEETPSTSGKTDGLTGRHSFSELCNALPSKISKNMAKNLSVPIAFVCLLHLANEKTLNLESDPSMADLHISQG